MLSDTLFVNTLKVKKPLDLLYLGCKIFGINATLYEEGD